MSHLYSKWRRTAAGKVENPCIWYKQNGNPASFKHAVRNDWDASFRVRWIGRRGFALTPQSPALAPFHFIFRGQLKRPIYETPMETEEILVAKILTAHELLITRLVILRGRARTRYTAAMREMKQGTALSNSSCGLIEKNTIKNSTHNTE
jgi:hypothetical protein